MANSDLGKLKTFFFALSKSNFHPERMDSHLINTQDKAYCFGLLRQRIPEFKDKDDEYISKYLADYRYVENYVFPKFTNEERLELQKSFEETPIATEPVNPPPNEQETVPPIGPQADTPSSALPFGIPAGGPTISPSAPRRVLIMEKPTPGKTDRTGEGTAATAKTNRIAAQTASRRINFSALGSKVGGRIAGAAKTGLETANPFLKKMGNGLVNNLTSIANLRGGIGTGGSRSIFGRISSFGRGGGSGGIGSLATKAKKRGGLIFALGIIGFMMLVGAIAISGTPSTGEAAPATPGGTTEKPTIIPPPPLADGNYQKWVQEYGINISNGFMPEVYRWAYEILITASNTAPKFQILLGVSQATPIEIKPICDISHTSGRTIFIRNRIQFCPGATKEGPTQSEELFKQNFIHELGHIVNGSSRPGIYGNRIKQAISADHGYLTMYAEKAATADDEICGEGDENTRADEDFAESVSYFINKDIPEQNYGCGTKLRGSNPFMLKAPPSATTITDKPLPLLYEAHYQLMTNLLK